MAAKPRTGAPIARRPTVAAWSKAFLAELALTSNVSAAARKAGVSTTTIYDTRRTNSEFNRKWQQALCEGYELLEIELLQRMRTGEVKPAAGAKRGTRTFDNAIALRLLGAHKEATSRQRAIRGNEDSEAILLSLNAKIERIRQRAIADGEIMGADGEIMGPDGEIMGAHGENKSADGEMGADGMTTVTDDPAA